MLRGFQTGCHRDVYVADTTHYSNAANDDQTGDESILRFLGQLQKLHDVGINRYPLASAPESAGDSGDTEFLVQKLGIASLDLS
jgi:hypothetical protein